MASWESLFGKESVIYQMFVWGVVQQVITSLAGPYFNDLTYLVNAKDPNVLLSPADLANAVVRNYMSGSDAAVEAAKSGLNASRLQTLVHLSGDAPAPGDLAIALRRAVIPETGTGPDAVSFDQGIREGRLADKWIPMMKALSQQWPTPTDALDALLEGQIGAAEGKDLYAKFGGDPDYFDLLFNTRGSAPTPLEASVMANRGIIPWAGRGPTATSFEQAFLEGPWRDKWQKPYEEMAVYVIPESTVRVLLDHNAITPQYAAELLKKQGMTQADIQAYITDAAATATETYRGLTTATVLDMYYSQLISESDATAILTEMHVSAEHAALLLAYADMQRAIAAVKSAVTRVQTLYVGHKITRETAVNSLNSLKVPATAVQSIIATWDLEVSANVKTLTESQIADAFAYTIMDQAQAMTELQNIGYTPYDAWVVLSIKSKAPLPNPPPPGPAAPQGAVIPGTT